MLVNRWKTCPFRAQNIVGAVGCPLHHIWEVSHMRKVVVASMALALAVLSTACVQRFDTNLAEVAANAGMVNVTTSDADFSQYVATGEYEAYEWGWALGIPPLKFYEIWPALTNEELLGEAAAMAANDGAKGMCDVNPHYDFFTGIPFGILGIYWDYASGTGVAAR